MGHLHRRLFKLIQRALQVYTSSSPSPAAASTTSGVVLSRLLHTARCNVRTLPKERNYATSLGLLHTAASDRNSDHSAHDLFQKGKQKKKSDKDKSSSQQNERVTCLQTNGVGDASIIETEDVDVIVDVDEADDESDVESQETESEMEPPIDAEDEEGMKKKRKELWQKLSLKERRKLGLKMAKRMVSDALDGPHEEEDGEIPEHRQRSLRVGILGPANAGKSSLTNFLVGSKVAAVSRKRNTTLSEILGVVTKGDTQILLYDTPGLVLDILGHPSKTDTRRRSETAWQLLDHCEVLVVLVDSYRQIMKPDKRILRLVERVGKEENPHPKRVLCLNKVDIIKKKPDLLPLAEQFGNLPGFDSIFMISALTGSGVKQLEEYLTDQAVLRPWDEEPDPLNEEVLRTLSMEVVREHLLNRVHEEIPYELEHELTGWDELKDGSLRIEQHFYLPKKGQCRILVGKGGSKIREIGIAACEELRKLMGRTVHLFLEVNHISRL